MSKQHYRSGSNLSNSFSSLNLRMHKGLFVGLILFVALIAFEIFNFDTTQFALKSLLGEVTFLGLHWATILAVAFCAIDFAGLNRLFSPEGGSNESREVWYLMGAWLLGATMNAVMTWWAVSVTLLNNNFGNEVLSREQLLRYVPIFVAVLVWLTRILFIGSLSIAGAHLFNSGHSKVKSSHSRSARSRPAKATPKRQTAPSRLNAAPKRVNSAAPQQSVMSSSVSNSRLEPASKSRSSRVRQRPPVPNGGMARNSSRIQASQRSHS